MVTREMTATIAAAWSSGMVFPPSGFAQDGEQGGDGQHGGNQENLRPKQQQAHRRHPKAGEGGNVILGGEPLFHEDGDKQGGEDKVDALQIHRQQGTGQTTHHGTGNPVELIQDRHQQTVAVAVDSLRDMGDQGVGLIGEGKNQVGLFLSGAFVGIHHGDAVKQVPCVDQEGGHGGGEQSGAAAEQADGHILHGPGVDEQAHGGGPDQTVARLLQGNAESEAQEQVAGHHRHGVQKGGSKKGRFHEYSSEFWGTLLYEMIICPRRWKVNGPEKEGVDKGEGMWYTIQVAKISAYRGVEQLEARRAHNPEAAGSSPASATIKTA